MKKLVSLFIIVLSACLALEALAEDEDFKNMPGYFDFRLSDEFSDRETSVEVYVKEPEKLKVRVMMGLKPEIDKRLGRTSPHNLPEKVV